MNARQLLSALVLVLATILLGYLPEQSDFSLIIVFGALAFAAYGYLAFFSKLPIIAICGVGICSRLILFFAFPNLSDDIYRFLWDGQLTALGINPYGHIPAKFIASPISGLDPSLFDQMNSPDYYTIYPPVAQLIFYLSTWFSSEIYSMSLTIKLFFLMAEIATFYGLVRILMALDKPSHLAALYFLNPLILVEGMVNLHFEMIMIAFLVWSIYFIFIKKDIQMGGILLTLSIASKLLPLMFLPYFLFRMQGPQRIRFFAVGLVSMIIAFMPIILGLDFQNFGSSVDLYFQKFEFNGGIYYLLRFVGKLLTGYNLIHYIGPGLGLMALFLILRKARAEKTYDLKSFLDFAFFSFLAYLFLTTTVHPWYLSVPVMLSVFVQWRFALVWSFLILLTYINYSYDPYWENLWIVGFEYVMVFSLMMMENRGVFSKRHLSST